MQGTSEQLYATFGAPPPVNVTPSTPVDGQAAGQGGDAPLTLTIPQPVITAPTGRDALPAIAQGMRLEESGDQHFNADGTVKLGPKTKYGQAVGVSQIMPGTEPAGVDIYDEKQNKAEGENRLGVLYDKYGSWDNTLIAYDWGEKNTDAWLAKGGDFAALPAETRKYVPQVLANAGFDASGLTSSKRQGTVADIADAMGHSAPGTAPADLTDALGQAFTNVGAGIPGGAMVPTDEEGGRIVERQTEALLQGARDGLTDLLTGPLQLGAKAIGEEAPFTAMVNNIKRNYAGGVEAQDEHPAFSFAGQLIGVGTALYATKGLLGGPMAMLGGGSAAVETTQAMIKSIPAAIRAMGVGGLLGATQYNPDPAHTSRIAETALSAIFGGAAAETGKALSWIMRKAADRATYNTGLDWIKSGVGEITRNSGEARDAFINHVRSLVKTKNDLYGERAPGGEGLEPAPFRDVMRAPVEASRLNGVNASPTALTWAKRAYKELGFEDADKKRAIVDAAQKEHAVGMADWEKRYGVVPKAFKDPNAQEAFRQGRIQRAVANGRVPPPPEPPPSYVEPDIKPQQLSAAQRAVNEGVARTKNDPKARAQLLHLGRQLQGAVEAQAASLGMDVKTYLRQTQRANDFFEKNIVPLRKIFKTSDPSQLLDKFTSAQFFDEVGHVIDRNDKEELRAFKAVVGKAGQEQMRRVALWNVLNDRQPSTGGKFVPQRAIEYINKNKDALMELFDRDGVQMLQGWAKLAETVTANPAKHAGRGFFSSALPYIGMERIAAGVIRGQVTHGLIEGGSLMAAPVIAHAIFGFAARAETIPGVTPLIKAMSHLPAGSPQLEARVQRIEALSARAGSIGARGLSSQVAGPTPSAGPLVPVQ